MLAVVYFNDGISIEFDHVEKTYVQDKALLVLAFRMPLPDSKEYPLITKKFPLSTVKEIEEVDPSWVETRKELEDKAREKGDLDNLLEKAKALKKVVESIV